MTLDKLDELTATVRETFWKGLAQIDEKTLSLIPAEIADRAIEALRELKERADVQR